MENARKYFDFLYTITSLQNDNEENEKLEELDKITEATLFNIQKSIIKQQTDSSLNRYGALLGLELGRIYSRFESHITHNINLETTEVTNQSKEETSEKYRKYEDKISDIHFLLLEKANTYIDHIVFIFNFCSINITSSINFFYTEYTDPSIFWDFFGSDKDLLPIQEQIARTTEANKQNTNTTKRGFKSKMTQAQLCTMFRLLRDNNIIDSRLPNTSLANIIRQLTGGSYQKIREYLGGSNATHINMTLDTKEQAKEIQDILSDIITQIEKEKRDIIK